MVKIISEWKQAKVMCKDCKSNFSNTEDYFKHRDLCKKTQPLYILEKEDDLMEQQSPKQVIEIIDLELKHKIHSEILDVLDKYQIDDNIALEILENIVFDIRIEQRFNLGDMENV